jgi:hypothetical protein
VKPISNCATFEFVWSENDFRNKEVPLVLWCVYSYRCPYCCKEARYVVLGRGVCWCRLFGTADCCQKTRSAETGTYESIFLPPLMFLVPPRRRSTETGTYESIFLPPLMFLGPPRRRSTETGTYENIFLPSLMFLAPLRTECGDRYV